MFKKESVAVKNYSIRHVNNEKCRIQLDGLQNLRKKPDHSKTTKVDVFLFYFLKQILNIEEYFEQVNYSFLH